MEKYEIKDEVEISKRRGEYPWNVKNRYGTQVCGPQVCVPACK